jgi:hypothetical protein
MTEETTKTSIDRETAEHELQRFLDAMDLVMSTDGMDENDKRDYTKDRDTLVRAIMSRRVDVNDVGECTLHTRDDKHITFHEPTGASLLAMDKKKPTQEVGKLYAAMADFCKVPPVTFSKMGNSDLKIAMAIYLLFLA